MRALSIRQPWASLIVNGSKPIENRTWKTRVRGWVLVHASRDLQRGGIIGAMRIDDCVTADASPWFTGPYGFVIGAAVQLPFLPVSGKQGFFNVPLPGDYVSEVIKALRTIEPEIGLLDLF
jgi:hypothetical protein